MADQGSASPPVSESVCVGTDDCPPVAELIYYALGQAVGEEYRRVEIHLSKGECGYCRRWISNASRHRQEPRALADGKGLDPSAVFPDGRAPVVDPSDLTPIPPSSRWQRQMFLELEVRLTKLEDGTAG